ncbi:hypothetical protein [Prescottella equi]|uniref:hypothetical protein n=1 Tax=Rhodococcus hoagii TaxID=43767 RepID=UPI000A56B7A2|nr:hypothetical protein [Prescottella equi]
MTLGATSKRLWLTTAVLLLVISMGSVAWVLSGAPPAADDQAFRATVAGWGIGIAALLLAVVSLAIALRSETAEPPAGPAHSPGAHITQVIDGGSTGTIGGTHTWGPRDPPKGPR